MTTSPEPSSELEGVAQTLADLQRRIADFDEALQAPDDDVLYRPPIIDQTSSSEYVQAELEGWKKYVGQVQAEVDWVTGLLESPSPPKDLGTSNTSHLVTMFNSISTAPRPIVCINHHFSFPSSAPGPSVIGVKKGGRGGKEAPPGSKMIKVDVVGRGGKEWIRTNTIKLQKLMSELHEQDSYLNSDFDSSSTHASSSTRPPLTNSILTTAQHLLTAAAYQPRPKGYPIPTITYRLTRLLPEDEYDYPDDRVHETFQQLRSWGINLVFGDGSHLPIQGLRRVCELSPTLHINLDLSVIIALVSDITHHPLPTDIEDARRRFLRPVDNVSDSEVPHGGKPSPKLHPDTTSGIGLVENPGLHSKHTRNLVLQITQEMERGIVEEIQSVLASLLEKQPEGTKVEFWCTPGAKRGLEEIVRVNEVVGDGHEQRRSRALFKDEGMSEGSFWLDSRHQGREGVLKDFYINVLDEQVSEPPAATRTAFMQRLVQLCASLNDTNKTRPAEPAVGQDSTTTTNTRNPSLVTLDSLQRGAQYGMTTLTNNRMSVKQLLRAMRKWDGWAPGDYDDVEGSHTAAMWVMEARSLAEWTRVKFAAGNYSKGGQDGQGHRWPRVSQYVKVVENVQQQQA